MEFKNLEELKSFLIWARSQKLEEIEISGIKARFSAYSMLPGVSEVSEPDPDIPTYKPNSKTWDQVDVSEEDEEELLFHSATGN